MERLFVNKILSDPATSEVCGFKTDKYITDEQKSTDFICSTVRSDQDFWKITTKANPYCESSSPLSGIHSSGHSL